MPSRSRIALVHFAQHADASQARAALIQQGLDSHSIMYEFEGQMSALRIALPLEQERPVLSYLLSSNATRVDVHDVH